MIGIPRVKRLLYRSWGYTVSGGRIVGWEKRKGPYRLRALLESRV